jgi:hypothetical protein
MSTILPKRGRVDVGKRLEFVYKTVTILQKFHRARKVSSKRKLHRCPVLGVEKLTIRTITVKNNDLPRMDVMKFGEKPCEGHAFARLNFPYKG